MKQVGRELGVRYVLEGSVRKAGNRIRVTAQLVEAETGNHVWAERYDRDLADIFAVQDEITEAVTIAIAPAIADAERQRAMRKPPESLDALGPPTSAGCGISAKSLADDNALAQRFFQRGHRSRPELRRRLCGARLMPKPEPQAYIGERTLSEIEQTVFGLARRAVTLDGNDAEARAHFALQLMRRGDYEGALAEAELALAISPNLAAAYGVLGAVVNVVGPPERRAGRS